VALEKTGSTNFDAKSLVNYSKRSPARPERTGFEEKNQAERKHWSNCGRSGGERLWA
jgi:hypothetical protein